MKLSEKVFTPQNLLAQIITAYHLGPKFQVVPLEEAILDIISEALKTTKEESMKVLLKEDDNEEKVDCKVLVNLTN